MFDEAVKCVLPETVCTLHHVYVGQFNSNRIIKPTDVTVIVKTNNELEFDIKKQFIETWIQGIKRSFIGTDLKTVVMKTLCATCKSPL